MNTHADKTPNNKSQSVAQEVSQKRSSSESTFKFVDNRPEAIAQRKLQEMANNSLQTMQLRSFEKIASNSLQAKKNVPLQFASTSNNDNVIQRLIVNAGASSLMDEAKKPSGWITLSTLDVGIKMDTGTNIIERGNIGTGWKIPKDENIFIVGHGAKGKMAAAVSGELADQLRPVIPDGWTGFIAGLTCHAGLAKEGLGEKSGGQQLHENLNTPVIAAKGSTFTHPGIDMAVRVLKDTSYSDDFRHHYFNELKFPTYLKRLMLTKTWPNIEWIKTATDTVIDETFLEYGKSVDTSHPEIASIFSKIDYSKMSQRSQESMAIDEKHLNLNQSWAKYMANPAGSLSEIAAYASELSAEFYESVVEYGDKYGLLHDVDSDFEYYE